MRKSLVAGALVVLGGAGAAVPYFTGMRAEQAFRENLRSVSEHPQVDLRLVRYERHWLGAEAESELTVESGGERITMHLGHQIVHGPTPTNPALARVTTTPALEGEARKAAAHYFGERAPLTADLTIGLGGNQRLVLSSPAFKGSPRGAPDTRVQWGGLSGEGRFHGGEGSLRLKVPELRVSDDKGRLRLQDVALRSDFRRHAPDLWLGDSTLSAAHFEMALPDADADALHHLELAELDYTQQAELSEDGDSLTLAGELRAEQARTDDRKLRDARLGVELRRLDAAAYQEISRRFRALDTGNLSEEAMAAEGLAIFREMLPRFLDSSPELALTELSFKAPGGDFRGTARARYTGDGRKAQRALDDPAVLLQELEAEAEIRAGKSLVIGVLEDRAREQLRKEAGPRSNPVQMERAVERSVSQRLGMMQAFGFLEAEGERFISKVAWNRGTLTINGRPLNLGGALGGGSAVP
ncbi:YdgA family protein [Thiohalorhabdus methylotrophus]|uniref:YdgA family protein n=1 Tax=Thiohalorhabdus methylotrophus TaxID=3242694 RepID=A0ABV4TZ03_9GAMM